MVEDDPSLSVRVVRSTGVERVYPRDGMSSGLKHPQPDPIDVTRELYLGHWHWHWRWAKYSNSMHSIISLLPNKTASVLTIAAA